MPDLKVLLSMQNYDLSKNIDVYKFQDNLKGTISRFIDVYFKTKNLPRIITIDDLVDSLNIFMIDKYIITTESNRCINDSIVESDEEFIKCVSWKEISTDKYVGIKNMIKRQHEFNEKLSNRLVEVTNNHGKYEQILPDLLDLLPPMGLDEQIINNNFKILKIPKVQFTTKMALMRINYKWINNNKGQLIRHITHITLMTKVDEVEFYRIGEDFEFLRDYTIPVRANFDYVDYRLSKSRDSTISWLSSLPKFNYKQLISKKVFIAYSENEVSELTCYSPDISHIMQQLSYKINKQYANNNITGLGFELIGLTVTKNEVIQHQDRKSVV